MKKWLVLGLLGLAVAWGPYVYSQLTSSPVRVHGKARHGFAFLGGDEQAEDEGETPESEAPTAEDPAQEPTEPAAEAKAEPEAKPEATKKPGEPATGEPSAAKAKLAGGDPAAAEEPAPSLPSELVPAFRKVFDAEPRDAFWANDEEPRVSALFKTAGASPDAVSELACRTTVCRVAFIPDELEPEALAKLYTSLHGRYADLLALDAKPGAVGEKATLFVLRPGYKLEH